MFADIAGSTAMYEKYGNVVAEKVISTAIKHIDNVITKHNGIIVKYIGDEVLCYFDKPDNSVKAAIKIQEMCDGGIPTLTIPISVRIGLDYGEVILSENKDIFGDAVNTAARMVGYAKAEQIITNDSVVSNISLDLKSMATQFDRVKVKGKSNFLGIYRINWEVDSDDVTRIVTSDDYLDDENDDEVTIRRESVLNLYYQGQEYSFRDDGSEFRIGRDPKSDLVIIGGPASRKHGLIALQRDKFVYYDSSTNGTTISFDSGGSFFLLRENMALYDRGLICLGDTINDKEKSDKENVIRFQLTDA